MKNNKIISFLLLMFCTSILSVSAQCPDEGGGKTDKEKVLNKQKNRSCVIFAGDSISDVPIDSILKSGNDLTRFNVSQLITVEGYITLMKYGSSESCNCHTKDKTKLDIHLEIGKSPADKNTQSFICEVTPKYHYRDRIDWKSFNGKKVRITGYVFYDLEHEQNAVNTNPKGTNLWRASIVEVHPVINIELIR